MGDNKSDLAGDDTNIFSTEQASESNGAESMVESPLESEESGVPDIASVIQAAQEENAKLKDRLLRAAAEMENLRKRTRREVSDARTYAIADFARDMLNATDNLDRALSTIPEEMRQHEDPAIKTLIEGIEMTGREMQRLMQKHGVKPIIAEGEKFNPHKHQAMFEVPDASVPAGIVVQVVQSGFEIGERVLRPAMVGVSKGGEKPAAPSSVKIEPRVEGAEDNGFDDDFPDHIDREV